MNDFDGLAPAVVAGAGINDLPQVVQPSLIEESGLVEVMPDWRFRTYDSSPDHLANRRGPAGKRRLLFSGRAFQPKQTMSVEVYLRAPARGEFDGRYPLVAAKFRAREIRRDPGESRLAVSVAQFLVELARANFARDRMRQNRRSLICDPLGYDRYFAQTGSFGAFKSAASNTCA
jgi:hypothetical protein